MFENKPLKKIVGNTADAPYLNSLINACSYSKNDLSLSTTSLANYVALTSGYTGCTAVDANFKCTQLKEITANKPSTTWPQATKSIFELMGSQAAEWNESAPTNCAAKGSGNYVDNHAPYHYYTRTQATLCKQFDQPFPAAPATTLSAQFNLVIPNKPDIMHLVPGTSISQRIKNGDNWAQGFIPQLLSSAGVPVRRHRDHHHLGRGQQLDLHGAADRDHAVHHGQGRVVGELQPLLGAQGHPADGRVRHPVAGSCRRRGRELDQGRRAVRPQTLSPPVAGRARVGP